MKGWIINLSLALTRIAVHTQVPPILLEACNQMERFNKRMECLRAANRSGSASLSGALAQPAYAAPTSTRSYTGQRAPPAT